MIDTDRYDEFNEGIKLSDGGTICFPLSDGSIQRIDKDGNTMETFYPEELDWQEWYEMFDTQKNLLAEVKRLRKIEQEHGRVIIDDWEHKPNGYALEDAPYAHPEYGQPYVTVYHGGCEYVGLLRLYKNEDGEVIE